MLRTIARFSMIALLSVAAADLAHATGNNEADPLVGDSDSVQLAAQMGIRFVDGSRSTVIIERDGKQYELNVATRELRALPPTAATVPVGQASDAQQPTQQSGSSATPEPKSDAKRYYRPGDDYLFTLPSGRPIDKHAWSINFTHRFPYEAAFTGPGRGDTLLGLDDFAIPSFGVQFGVTNQLSVSVYRSPSIIGRPIELGTRYNFLSERHGPFNAAFRFSIDGQNDFQRNFTTNFELQLSRSLGHWAQFYAIPTYSVNNRPVIALTDASLATPFPYQPCGGPAKGISPDSHLQACADTFSTGFGLAVDVRPTVALIAEIIPTFANATEMGIHRPPFSFAIQKKIYHHAFTFGFTTAPGTTASQRIATRAVFLQDPGSDTPAGIFVGFDLLRQIP